MPFIRLVNFARSRRGLFLFLPCTHNKTVQPVLPGPSCWLETVSQYVLQLRFGTLSASIRQLDSIGVLFLPLLGPAGSSRRATTSACLRRSLICTPLGV